VHLHPNAVLEGSVYCQRIIMDEGAVLLATVDMNWDGSKSAKGNLLTPVDSGSDGIAKAAG